MLTLKNEYPEDDMANKYPLLLLAALAFMVFLFSCGSDKSTAYTSPAPAATWDGTWVSGSVIASGTISVNITQSTFQPGTLPGTNPGPQTVNTFSGSVTMTGSPCFSSSPINGGTVTGNTISWSSPGIGNFTGTISGASISGTYTVTAAGACLGETGVFSLNITW
jgi:hypothetical protein